MLGPVCVQRCWVRSGGGIKLVEGLLGRLLSMVALNGPPPPLLLLLIMLRVIIVLLLLSPCGTVARDLQVLQGLERVRRHRHLQELVAMVPIEKDIGACDDGWRVWAQAVRVFTIGIGAPWRLTSMLWVNKVSLNGLSVVLFRVNA